MKSPHKIRRIPKASNIKSVQILQAFHCAEKKLFDWLTIETGKN